MTRIAFAASTTTIKAPYAAKKPSVTGPRPNWRPSTMPTTAASPVWTASATPVIRPLPSEPSPVEGVGLLIDTEAYAP